MPIYDDPNAVENVKHPTEEKLEAVNDALEYFGIAQNE